MALGQPAGVHSHLTLRESAARYAAVKIVYSRRLLPHPLVEPQVFHGAGWYCCMATPPGVG